MSEEEKRELKSQEELEAAAGGDGYECPDVEVNDVPDPEQGYIFVPVTLAANANVAANVNAAANANAAINANAVTNANVAVAANANAVANANASVNTNTNG